MNNHPFDDHSVGSNAEVSNDEHNNVHSGHRKLCRLSQLSPPSDKTADPLSKIQLVKQRKASLPILPLHRKSFADWLVEVDARHQEKKVRRQSCCPQHLNQPLYNDSDDFDPVYHRTCSQGSMDVASLGSSSENMDWKRLSTDHVTDSVSDIHEEDNLSRKLDSDEDDNESLPSETFSSPFNRFSWKHRSWRDRPMGLSMDIHIQRELCNVQEELKDYLDKLDVNSFGKRSAGCARRPNECLILEPSEMIVIDYPESQYMRPGQRSSCSTMNLEKLLALEQDEVRVSQNSNAQNTELPQELQNVQTVLQRSDQTHKRNSRASDTSSAYSGSDMMQSSVDEQDIDLSGLVESVVDSDDEEGYVESNDSLTVRDTVRECLEKDPVDRTEDDIEILLEFMQHLPAFANMTMATRRSLCAVMVFAVVEKAGTMVMNDEEELDSWSVIINGLVQIQKTDGTVDQLQMGASFGITPTMEKLYHRGVMTTITDNCQFVCIAQTDYYRILHQGEENTCKHEEDGEVVMVTEHRVLDGGSRQGHIVIRGTPSRLVKHLVEEHSSVDPTYVEDFLLTYRTFLNHPQEVASRLLSWFHEPLLKDRVTRVVLLWVNNHFNDFESDPEMMDFLERFESLLKKEHMTGQLRLLNIACGAKARPRIVTLTRGTRDEILHFSVLGGLERNCGIFVSKVERGSKAHEAGLKRGDQVLEVNGHNFEQIAHNRALEILRSATHLSITVKSNLSAFNDMLESPDCDPRIKKHASFSAGDEIDSPIKIPMPDNEGVVPPVIQGKLGKKEKAKTLGHRTKLRKALAKMNILAKPSDTALQHNQSDNELFAKGHRKNSTSSLSTSTPSTPLLGISSPDTFLAAYGIDDSRSDFPEHVLKVYRADQSCRYFLIHKETTARQVVMLALRQFGIVDPSSNLSSLNVPCSNYSLCEVSVEHGGVVKQKRLPDQVTNLPDRIGLNARYYLKNNMNSENLCPEEVLSELVKESATNFLQLNTMELAIQLTLEDFQIFNDIEPTEYVDDLLKLNSHYGTKQLHKFAELVNKEMFWVVTEICHETNIVKRMKLIKHFIKIARHCKESKNFNSMFAIISGLGHGCVTRLRNTWDKLPSKYVKMFEDLQDFMDPSRNMSKYRNLLNSEHVQPPVIPFFPVVKKDLTFIHLGNDSKVEGLINFEKLRMVAKEVRHVCNMTSSQYDPCNMFGHSNIPSGLFMFGNNPNYSASGIATLRKKKRGSSLPNPKRMYEEAQMVRRVKSYLSNMNVVTDEEKLNEMSCSCETPANKKVNNDSGSDQKPPTVVIPKGPMFGADDPNAVRKLMSLSEKARPLNPKHHYQPVTSPLVMRKPPSPRQSRSLQAPSSGLLPETSSLGALRKSQTLHSIGSTSSIETVGPSVGQHHYDTDSGHNSVASSSFDSRSISSVGSASSPLQTRRPLSSSLPQSASIANGNARPPLPPYHVVVQNSAAYSQFIHQQYTQMPHRPLPDYHSATQLTNNKPPGKMGRSYSHEVVPSKYYEVSGNTLNGSESGEEEQVSAV